MSECHVALEEEVDWKTNMHVFHKRIKHDTVENITIGTYIGSVSCMIMQPFMRLSK